MENFEEEYKHPEPRDLTYLVYIRKQELGGRFKWKDFAAEMNDGDFFDVDSVHAAKKVCQVLFKAFYAMKRKKHPDGTYRIYRMGIWPPNDFKD